MGGLCRARRRCADCPLASRYRPPVIVAGGIGLILVTLATSYVIFIRSGWLTDGLGVSFALGFVLLVTSMSSSPMSGGPSGSPASVSRNICRNRWSPVTSTIRNWAGSAARNGRSRRVFTDIEAFRCLAKRAGPARADPPARCLFREVTKLIADHGGMIDKIVGDASMPCSMRRKISTTMSTRRFDCAIAIVTLTEAMRLRPEFAALDFGRTRIGIETGMAGAWRSGGGRQARLHGPWRLRSISPRACRMPTSFSETTICIGTAGGQRMPRHACLPGRS